MAKARQRPKAIVGTATVRQFRPDDAEEASQVMVEAFRSFLPAKNRQKVLDGFSPAALRSTSTFGIKDADTVCYVAVSDGKVVGYIRGAVNAFGFGSLSVIGVSECCFRQGIGSLLMKKMMAFWRKNGMRKVSTCVSAHNSRALVFYLRHGFRPVGYQRDHFLPGMDEVILDLFFD